MIGLLKSIVPYFSPNQIVFMKKMALHWKIIIALVVGILFAWMAIAVGEFQIGSWKYDMRTLVLHWVKPWGDIFINVLKLIAVPLVLFSIIGGVASLSDIRKLGKMGFKTLGLYIGTTFAAVGVGLVLVNIWQPGTHVDEDTRVRNRISYEIWRDDNGVEKLDNLDLSTKPEYAAIVAELLGETEEVDNAWVADKMQKFAATQKAKEAYGPLKPLVDVVPKNIIPALGKPEMLQIIFFAIFAGVALVMIPKQHSEPVLKVVNGLSEMFIQMILIIMKAMPFFVFALMAGKLVEVAGSNMEAFLALLDFLWQYSVVVILGLLIMIFVFYPSLVHFLVKKISGRKFLSGMKVAQFTAFSTSSSMATLPVTMECVNDNLGVSERTTSFVLPIGATINMDGTSLYQGVAVVAMAQFHMIDLTLGQQLTIVLTATLASVGAAAIPSAGLVLMILVLDSVGLNPLWIALIFPVDRILDMCRTVVNVTGDGAVSTIVANSEGELGEGLDWHPG